MKKVFLSLFFLLILYPSLAFAETNPFCEINLSFPASIDDNWVDIYLDHRFEKNYTNTISLGSRAEVEALLYITPDFKLGLGFNYFSKNLCTAYLTVTRIYIPR
jgi:hypothetical protein